MRSSRRCSSSISFCGSKCRDCILAKFLQKGDPMNRAPLLLSLSLLLAASAFGGTLFGLRNPGDGGRQVVIVDPATGAVTPVSASISAPLPSASGVNALDVAG